MKNTLKKLKKIGIYTRIAIAFLFVGFMLGVMITGYLHNMANGI